MPTDTPELDIPRLDNSADDSDPTGSTNFLDSTATGEDLAVQSNHAEAIDGVDVVDTIELPLLRLSGPSAKACLGGGSLDHLMEAKHR